MKLVTDTGTVFVRELRPVLSNPFSVIFGLVQPLVFLGLFSPLLGGMPSFGPESSLQWFVPGVLVMIALFGTSTTGSNLHLEMQSGSHERMLVTPLSRSALLIGRALKEIAPTVAQSLLIVALTIPFGFNVSPVGMLVGLVMLAVFSVGLGALSYSLALAVKSAEWMFWAVQQSLIFPMLILSGMLLPIDVAPDWLKIAANVNPLTYIVDAERVLFAGDLSHPAVLGGAISAAVTAAVGLWVGIQSMQKAS